MKSSIKLLGATLALVMATGGVAVAGTQLKTQTRDQLRDGSCISQLRTRDQLRDGSCVAKAQKRVRKQVRDGSGTKAQKRDRLRDGSCVA